MAGAPTFPAEIWLQIIQNFRGPEVVWLSISCSRLREICSERLDEIRKLYCTYRSYNHDAARRIDYNILSVDWFPYHLFLARILRGELLPSTVIEMDTCSECKMFDEEPWNISHRPYRVFEEADLTLFKEAVYDSPWITEDEAASCYDYICEGDEDAVLAVLLPLLDNLRWFRPPAFTPRLTKVIGRIAAATSPISKTRNLDIAEPPLAKLVQVNTDVTCQLTNGMETEELACYAALPSVKRIIAGGMRDAHFYGWPDGVPHSRVPEVYFECSGSSAEFIQEFAKRFDAPCMMRQEYYSDGRCPEPQEWDHFEICGEVDEENGTVVVGTRRERMGLKVPGIGYVTGGWSYSERERKRDQAWRRRHSDGMFMFWNQDRQSWKTIG